MKIARQIERLLRDQYARGLNHQQIAEKLNITHQYVQRWLAKSNLLDNISLKTVQKMFPNATLNFDGLPAKIAQKGNNNTIAHAINAPVINGDNNSVVIEKTLSALLDKVMTNDKISSESKIEVYNIIKSANKPE